MTKVEILGYHDIRLEHIPYFENVFRILKIIPLEDFILDKAIQLRQQHRMKLADSLIAASTLLYDLELQTRNIADFKNIPKLKLNTPIT
ncbi:MAG: hypothetical protein SFU99_22120 [Saprospiraceae bacterium]|nr:hypothetical protein [Saprospiraceae bacterium]